MLPNGCLISVGVICVLKLSRIYKRMLIGLVDVVNNQSALSEFSDANNHCKLFYTPDIPKRYLRNKLGFISNGSLSVSGKGLTHVN